MYKKTIKVYDTISGQMIDVDVTEKVYQAYMRTGWNIQDNNASFYKHEIQFSMLVGGKADAFEHFREFISEDNIVDDAAILNTYIDKLKKALAELPEDDHKLIYQLFFQNKTERELALQYNISHKNIHKKKVRILCRLNKLLKE